jgi:hypothetical protein
LVIWLIIIVVLCLLQLFIQFTSYGVTIWRPIYFLWNLMYRHHWLSYKEASGYSGIAGDSYSRNSLIFNGGRLIMIIYDELQPKRSILCHGGWFWKVYVLIFFFWINMYLKHWDFLFFFTKSFFSRIFSNICILGW